MIWQYILAFVLFLLCLSILIMIHEAGHLAAAKIFKVYCFDYSIGFGPALFHKKRKNGETYFSIRAIPFGGFVSMYGENEDGSELPDGIESIPEERALSKIKPWKRAIVLAAGVTLNAILALVLFFVSSCLPQQHLYLRNFEVEEGSVAYNAGLTDTDTLFIETYKGFPDGTNDLEKDLKPKEGESSYSFANRVLEHKTDYSLDFIKWATFEVEIGDALKYGYYIFDKETIVTFNDSTTKKAATLLDASQKSKLSFKTRDYDTIIKYFYLDNNGVINYATPVELVGANVASVTVNFKTVTYSEENPNEPILTGNTYSLVLNNHDGTLDSYGMSVLLYTERYNFKQIVQNTFYTFGDSSILIFKTIGGLFVGKGWDQVGGIVAVAQQSTTIFMEYNASLFIYLWALISVNLAVFNLLPFPGLDGWQLLVLAIESISKKKIPPKVKTIVSLVGMILLFTFMALIIVKDVMGLF